MTDTLDAPYNFVPLSGQVFEPDWAGTVHQDLPLANGLSGRVRYRIRANGPILVGGTHRPATSTQPGQVRFFQLPDGGFAIPGSSVRGMIRNVLEIATFARMQLVDDRRYGLRDLTGPVSDDYRKRITNPQAGWLRFDASAAEGAHWNVKPCKCGRITHEQIATLSGQPVREFAKPRTTAMDKYRVWARGEKRGSLEIEVVVGEPRGAPGFVECFLPEERTNAEGRKGTLVMTGQPNSKKRREFVFFDDQQEEVPVPPEVMAGFLDVHEGTSAEWTYWRRHLDAGARVPVFYLLADDDRPLAEGGEIGAFGLAMMFKLASRFSTHELRGDRHGEVDRFDLAELIFGRAHDEVGQSLRGRVSFGVARLDEPADPHLRRFDPSVLGQPKASFFPTYLRQPQEPSAPGLLPRGEGYRTWMTEGAELAGWKRYPIHAENERRGLPRLNQTNQDNKKVQVELHALDGSDQELVFEGWLRFHNLRPEELGALVWCVEWGGRHELRHAIGLARASAPSP